jgi:chromosome segregation ATPase
MMTFFSKGGWVVILLGIVAGWFAREIKAAERRGALEAQVAALQAEADSLLGHVRDSLTLEITAAREREQALAAVQDGMQGEMASLRRARLRAVQDLEDVLASVPTDSRDQIVAVIDTLEREVEVCNLALGTCEERVEAAHGQLEAMGRRALNAEALAEQQQRQIGDLTKDLRHGFQVMDAVPWAVAAVAIVFAILK